MISSTKLRVSSSFLCVCGGKAWAAISAQSPIPPPSRLAHAPGACSLIGLPTLSPSRPCILAHVPADESLCQLTLFRTLCEKRVSAPTTLISGNPSSSKDSSFNLHLKHSAGGILSLRFSRHYETTTTRGQHHKAHACKLDLHLTRRHGTQAATPEVAGLLPAAIPKKTNTSALASCVESDRRGLGQPGHYGVLRRAAMDGRSHRCRQVPGSAVTPPGHTSFHLLTNHTAKLEAVERLMEKLAADLEKQDLTTERE